MGLAGKVKENIARRSSFHIREDRASRRARWQRLMPRRSAVSFDLRIGFGFGRKTRLVVRFHPHLIDTSPHDKAAKGVFMRLCQETSPCGTILIDPGPGWRRSAEVMTPRSSKRVDVEDGFRDDFQSVPILVHSSIQISNGSRLLVSNSVHSVDFTDDNRVFYEQALMSRVEVFVFPLSGVLALLLLVCVAPRCCSSRGFYTHSDELGCSKLGAGWVREKSRCCYFSAGLGRPKRRRSHRNAGSSQQIKGYLYAAVP